MELNRREEDGRKKGAEENYMVAPSDVLHVGCLRGQTKWRTSLPCLFFKSQKNNSGFVRTDRSPKIPKKKAPMSDVVSFIEKTLFPERDPAEGISKAEGISSRTTTGSPKKQRGISSRTTTNQQSHACVSGAQALCRERAACLPPASYDGAHLIQWCWPINPQCQRVFQ